MTADGDGTQGGRCWFAGRVHGARDGGGRTDLWEGVAFFRVSSSPSASVLSSFSPLEHECLFFLLFIFFRFSPLDLPVLVWRMQLRQGEELCVQNIGIRVVMPE